MAKKEKQGKKEKEVKTKNKKQKSHYFKDMKAELKKVIWPTPKQLANNTMGVIIFTLILAAIVLVLDLCFDAVSKYGITAAQEKIQSSYSNSAENSEADAETDTNTDADSDINADTDTDTGAESDEDDGQNIEVETENSSSEE